ncbi:Smr/MutS family protein [Oricola thermophila]|uniref:Smr/MutS family protein n=1 Tax=Oricola thermophila TaxID=2742145 RepID=A0A6N1VG65_9HYPH|nr:Smr/MutS family protein [Oricola thermophila]QKV19824.1 Smr/MutS family protein [Oricola thermophila]
MSGKRHRRSLTEEERRLWRRVGRTVTPLRDRDVAMPDSENLGREFLDAMDTAGPQDGPPARDRKSPLARRYAPPPPPPKPSREPGIDRPTTRKLAKGRISIDARMDLHEMTQDVAYDRLYAFLADQRSRGARHVLVVTGKGRSPGSEGILKRMVPVWLNSARFAGLVSGYTQASRHHGGEGAIYVRLRRLSHPDGSLRP